MKLMHYHPRSELSALDLFDRFFSPEGFATAIYGNDRSSWLPKTDIIEEKDKFIVTLELSGLKKDEVHVNVENGRLTVKGERKDIKESKDTQYHRIERSYGAFERSFKLSNTVKQDQISAVFKDGLLTIEVPKAEEVKPKEIEVKIV